MPSPFPLVHAHATRLPARLTAPGRTSRPGRSRGDRAPSRAGLRLACLCAGLIVGHAAPGQALEYLEAIRNEEQVQLVGEIVVEAQDGGMLLRTADGGLHVLPAKAIVSRRSDDAALELLQREALAAAVLSELPEGFQVHHSTNYVIAYNTTRTYARWCSSLLERLHKAFLAYWQKKGCDVKRPQQPLVVLVFGDQASYAAYARRDLGGPPGTIIGYYSLTSNRVMMYDLTGMQALQAEADRRGSLHDITALLSQPAAEPLLATIVHEATHQIAYNCGLQTRYVDNPLWVSEGLAAYFETPDVTSSRGWRGVGNVNYARWDRYRESEAQGAAASLERLLADDKLLRDPETALDGYAQAWAWNFFLLRWRPEQYAAYLQALAARPLLVSAAPAERVAEFKRHFGEDLAALEAEFFRQMSRLK